MANQKGTARQIYLVIHGHFYQPPRENPWTQHIPFQESAAPYHNWNERITSECYNPNTRSRVIDSTGKISSVVNNFAHINFNIGPTLFSWIEKYHPETYRRIREADRKSCEKYGGHGNAIAQVYNHIILPLANTRDKLTQIRWAKHEFWHRYGRKPESIWLAETAVNQETVECLINEGIKYIILSPTQAQEVRKIGEQDWSDVNQNSIDTTQSYRIFSEASSQSSTHGKRRFKKRWYRSLVPFSTRQLHYRDKLKLNYRNIYLRKTHNPDIFLKKRKFRQRKPQARYLDVFFYDGQLSTEISFHHLLRDASAFARRLHETSWKSSAPHVLIHVSTDGEIYGHHEPFADMCLAYAIQKEFPALGIEMTNYGSYLERYPSTMEVALKRGGETDEGTAWSCSHGVGRWYRDCGCSIGNVAEWNQQWRTPLRKGFDVLRDTLAEMFEYFLRDLLHSPWKAWDQYIECLLNPVDEAIDSFLEKHQKRPLNEIEQSLVLRLMEAQKYSMYTYTSCGWFFDDVSGIEVVQNMRYAARAIQLVEDLFLQRISCHPDPKSKAWFASQSLEALMLTEFEHAHSNIPEAGTAKDIYLHYAKPDMYTPERAANQWLLEKLFERVFHRASIASALTASGSQIYIYTLYSIIWEINRHSMSPISSGPLSGELEDDLTQGGHGVQQNTLCSGEVQVCDMTTRQTWKLLFITFMKRSDQPVSYIKRMRQEGDRKTFQSFLAPYISQQNQAFLISLQQFEQDLHKEGFTAYGLSDLYEEDRERLFYIMVQRGAQRLEQHLQSIYEESRKFLAGLATLRIGIPPELRTAIEFSLSYRLRRETEKLPIDQPGFRSPTHLSPELEELLHLSKTHHIVLDKTVLQDHLSETLRTYFSVLASLVPSCLQNDGDPPEDSTSLRERTLHFLKETLTLLDRADQLGLALDTTEAQNKIFEIFEDNILPVLMLWCKDRTILTKLERKVSFIELINTYLDLLEKLNFHVDRYKEMFVKMTYSVKRKT